MGKEWTEKSEEDQRKEKIEKIWVETTIFKCERYTFLQKNWSSNMKREQEKNFISDMREQILQALDKLKLQNFK